jgi:phosphonate transport system permease protein
VTEAAEKFASNPLRQPSDVARRYVVYVLVAILMAGMSYHLLFIETDWARMGSWGEIADNIFTLLPNLSFLPKIMIPLLETAIMAFWGTLLAVIVSVPVAYISATTTTPSMVLAFPLGKAIIVGSRSTHEIIFALLFVASLGLGPLPGILALACRSIGFMSKTTAEAIENVDRRPVEAIVSTGAGKVSQFLFGIVPQVLPIFLGNAIFQFDINIRRAAILGMVGAGGIGLYFSEQMKNYNYGNAGACVLAVVALVVVGEVISNRIRTKLIAG